MNIRHKLYSEVKSYVRKRERVRTERLVSGDSKSSGCGKYEVRSEKKMNYSDYLAVKKATVHE